jgi:hypothetical protein
MSESGRTEALRVAADGFDVGVPGAHAAKLIITRVAKRIFIHFPHMLQSYPILTQIEKE